MGREAREILTRHLMRGQNLCGPVHRNKQIAPVIFLFWLTDHGNAHRLMGHIIPFRRWWDVKFKCGEIIIEQKNNANQT